MTQAEMIEAIIKMDNEQQTSFYNTLRENGLSEADILAIQGVVFYTKLYSNPELYYAVRQEMAHRVYTSLTSN